MGEQLTVEEQRFERARDLYFGDRPYLPSDQLNQGRLVQAREGLTGIPLGKAQEALGWTCVEQMFRYADDEEGRHMLLGEAQQAFGDAYDLYGKEGRDFFQARLGIIAPALPIYERWAARADIDDATLAAYKTGIVQASKNILEAPRESIWQQYEETSIEAVVMLGALVKRGDNRKPVQSLAVPATLRQRMSLPRRQPGATRYNWGTTMLRRQQDGWRIQAGIKFLPPMEEKGWPPLHEHILRIYPSTILEVGANAMSVDGALRDLIDFTDTTARKPTSEQRKRAMAIHGRLYTVIGQKAVTGFASGTA